jgi:hypothetical protein
MISGTFLLALVRTGVCGLEAPRRFSPADFLEKAFFSSGTHIASTHFAKRG